MINLYKKNLFVFFSEFQIEIDELYTHSVILDSSFIQPVSTEPSTTQQNTALPPINQPSTASKVRALLPSKQPSTASKPSSTQTSTASQPSSSQPSTTSQAQLSSRTLKRKRTNKNEEKDNIELEILNLERERAKLDLAVSKQKFDSFERKQKLWDLKEKFYKHMLNEA